MRKIDLARLLNHVLRLHILVRRLVLGVKWAVLTHVSVLDSHKPLVAVCGIPFIEFLNGALWHRDLVYTLASDSLWRTNLDVNLGAHGSEVVIEQLFAAQRMMRVKLIERLQVALVASGNDLRQDVCLLSSIRFWLQ